MVDNVVIINEKDLEEKKEAIKKGGHGKFHVVSDFDRTITYGLTGEGKRTATVISQLRSDPKYLGKDYMDEAHRLFDVYRPIEIDPKIHLAEKKRKMHEWWTKHFDLIAQQDFTRDLIERVVRERPLRFRKGSLKLMQLLREKEIPIIFMSAAPGDMVERYLRQAGLMNGNVYIVANRYDFDDKGRALKIREPIIHTFNKTEVSLKGTDAYDAVKKRKNVLLFGDSIGDIGMIEGFPYKNLIKIGFLNEDIDSQLEDYMKNFDVVITGDQDFGFVNKLVREVLG